MTSSGEAGQTPATMSAGPDGRPVPYNWKVLRAVALILLAIKIATLIWVRPYMDETYYFMWGQHPGISYFDHPPLIGWVDMLSGAVFGWTRLALRVPVFLTLLGDLFVLYLFARRWDGDAWRPRFWLSAVLLLTMPVFFVMTGVALPDHLMILALLVAFYALELYFAADGQRLALGLCVRHGRHGELRMESGGGAGSPPHPDPLPRWGGGEGVEGLFGWLLSEPFRTI